MGSMTSASDSSCSSSHHVGVGLLRPRPLPGLAVGLERPASRTAMSPASGPKSSASAAARAGLTRRVVVGPVGLRRGARPSDAVAQVAQPLGHGHDRRRGDDEHAEDGEQHEQQAGDDGCVRPRQGAEAQPADPAAAGWTSRRRRRRARACRARRARGRRTRARARPSRWMTRPVAALSPGWRSTRQAEAEQQERQRTSRGAQRAGDDAADEPAEPAVTSHQTAKATRIAPADEDEARPSRRCAGRARGRRGRAGARPARARGRGRARPRPDAAPAGRGRGRPGPGRCGGRARRAGARRGPRPRLAGSGGARADLVGACPNAGIGCSNGSAGGRTRRGRAARRRRGGVRVAMLEG